MDKKIFMMEAIKEAKVGIHLGHGGPFGAVIVHKNEIVTRGHNEVLKTNDPTRHGEMVAIRNASRRLSTFNLKGCDLYTTGEPCPMCLAASMWADIENIYFGCTIEDNEKIGFRDNIFNNFMNIDRSKFKNLHMLERDKCLKLFDEYNSIQGRIIY